MESHPTLLLVEGNQADEARTRQAITNSEIDCSVQVARNGSEACQILFDSGGLPPSLVLLELKTPDLDGLDVLTQIRRHERTKRVPVVIFSASGNQADVERALDLHANSYVKKDDDLDWYETRLKLLLYYWIAVNKNVKT